VPERLPRLLPQALSPDQTAIYAKFTTGPRAAPRDGFSLVHPDGGLIGPPNSWLLSPPLGSALEQLGGAVRFHLTLPSRIRELAILAVGVACHSPFEVETHLGAARSAGVDDEAIAAVLAGREPQFDDDAERTAHDVTQAILRRHGLDDDLYATAVESLGERGLFELVTLVAYYELVATQLEVFGTAEDTAGVSA